MTGKEPEPASDKAADTTGSTAPVAAAQPANAAPPPPPPPAVTPAKAVAAPAPVKAPAPKPVKNAALKTPRSGGGSAGATGLAILSLLVAVGGVGIGIYALDVARKATSRANEAATTAITPAP